MEIVLIIMLNVIVRGVPTNSVSLCFGGAPAAPLYCDWQDLGSKLNTAQPYVEKYDTIWAAADVGETPVDATRPSRHYGRWQGRGR